MNTLKFKTNIKCAGCVETVTPPLNKIEGIENWEVDLQDPDRTLTVEADDENVSNEVVEALKSVGYTGQPKS